MNKKIDIVKRVIDFHSLLRSIILLIILNTSYPVSQTKDTLFAFISDTQTPLFIEKIWLKSSNNEEATDAIFSALLHEPDLSALFHLGDITSAGFLKDSWKTMSEHFLSLKKAGIQVYPVMGNHEYFIFPSKGRKMFFKNFPHLSSSWYMKQIGSIAVILLNSNFSHLTDYDISEQQTWFRKLVAQLDDDISVDFIIVGTHHSPYTNSKVVSPSKEVQRQFLPVFFSSKKCKLFLSGHAHTFEHFKKKGKDFLVIGGGGGLLQPLLKEQRFKDEYNNNKRMFHYMICRESKDSLEISVKMINPDFKTFSEIDKIKFQK